MENVFIIMEGEGVWTDGKIEDRELFERVKFYEKVSWEQQDQKPPKRQKCGSTDKRLCLSEASHLRQ